jgi:hypothetical protein
MDVAETVAALVTTNLSVSSIGGLFLNDGSLNPTGGLNDIISNIGFLYPNGNRIVIDLLDQGTGLIVETVTIEGDQVTGGLGTQTLTTAPYAGPKILTLVTLASFIAPAVVGGLFDFRIRVDTYNAGSVIAGSVTGYIADKLALVESIDMRAVGVRGLQSLGGVNLEGQLKVHRVTVTTDDCIVNQAAEVNGGDSFTFLGAGTFASSLGRIQVPSWEGWLNTPLAMTDFPFTATPSTDYDTVGLIASGSATIEDLVDVAFAPSVSIEGVLPGDMLVVSSPAITAGSYLIRYAIPEKNTVSAIPDTYEVLQSNLGWLELSHPKVVSLTFVNGFNGTLVTTPVSPISLSPSGYAFDSAGRLYVIRTTGDITQTVSVNYSSFIVLPDGNFQFTLTNATARDSSFVLITNEEFTANPGMVVGGHRYLRISRSGIGYQNGVTSAGGVTDVTIANTVLSGSKVFSYGVDLADTTLVAPIAGTLGVWVSESTLTVPSTSFVSDETLPVYEGMPLFLDLNGITVAEWSAIHGGTASGVRCIIPGDVITSGAAGIPGLYFRSGVYTEPSWPTPVQDLNDLTPKIVDAGHSLSRVGFRSLAAFGEGPTETINFTVRRIRRFHDVQSDITDTLAPLRFVYEPRTADIVSQIGKTINITNLYPDNDITSCGINPGDTLVTPNGNRTVTSILSATSFLVDLDVTLSPGDSVSFLLKQPPVPLVQTYEQLLSLITNELVLSSVANPVNGDGGRVDVANELKDPSVSDFRTIVQVGDLILVDPQGELQGASGVANPIEYGAPSNGDRGVIGRTGYLAGGPLELDDNRGVYTVTEVFQHRVVVSPITPVAGVNLSPVILGGTGSEYVVLPDIHASGLTGSTEGQNDLRPTAPAGLSSLDPNSYKGNFFSIEPFTYKVIRPSGILSADSTLYTLHSRERVLSWVEQIESYFVPEKAGDYYVFQQEEQASDFNLGVITNTDVTDISGEINYSPFLNSVDCLSILDRRLWISDLTLRETYPPYTIGMDPYMSDEQLPVDPDRITEILDASDRLRDFRYTWIRYRVNRQIGTLPKIEQVKDAGNQKALDKIYAQNIRKSK